MSTLHRVPTGACLLVALGAFAACGPSPDIQRQLEQLSVISAEKDSLLQQLVESNMLMSDISAELATVEAGPAMAVSPESPAAQSPTNPETMLARIHDITARVADSEKRLAESRRRVRSLTRESDSLKASVTQFEATIADFETVIANQKEMISALTARVYDLQAANDELVTLNTALVDTMSVLEDEIHTAYYVIGTKDELLERGIVVEEGGSRVLFIFGKRGKTLRPAHSLNADDFISIDRREVTSISFPDPEKDYRIASRQNLQYLAEPPGDKGKLRGGIQIRSADDFWRPSKFLIIVEG